MITEEELQRILILSGLPGSGKTFEANQWVAQDPANRVRLNYDDLREEMYGQDWKWNRPEEEKMKVRAMSAAIDAIGAGKSIVIDNTNLSPSARQKWVTLAKASGIIAELQDIDTPIHVCIERDRVRDYRRVGRAVIERMALFTGWIDWDDSMYPHRFVIFDIDGTLADGDHRKNFVEQGKKDWDSYYKRVMFDSPKRPTWSLMGDFAKLGYGIIIVSGRDLGKAGRATEDWLYEFEHLAGVPKPAFLHLFLRNAGDMRKDYIVKQEILDLLPSKRIAYVVDDRNQVVEMWRQNGLTCLQIAKGDF